MTDSFLVDVLNLYFKVICLTLVCVLGIRCFTIDICMNV